MSPHRIVPRHSQHELLHRRGRRRPAGSPAGAVVPLASDDSTRRATRYTIDSNIPPGSQPNGQNRETPSAQAHSYSRAPQGRRIEDQRTEQAELEAAWRQRALNSEDALKAAHHEIRTQRERIGELLGQVRDLQTHWTEEDLIRVVDDNNRLKKQVRQLTSDNSDLTNKLAAARDNARFADRRIAAIEAEYATATLA